MLLHLEKGDGEAVVAHGNITSSNFRSTQVDIN